LLSLGCSMYHTGKPLLCISVISWYFLFFCRLLFEKINKLNTKTQHW
jgi:hypothetical protein